MLIIVQYRLKGNEGRGPKDMGGGSWTGRWQQGTWGVGGEEHGGKTPAEEYWGRGVRDMEDRPQGT